MPSRKNTHLESFESIYKRLEEVLLANSGENEFEEIFKLVTLKLWEESRHTALVYSLNAANATLRKIDTEWKEVLLETHFNVTEEQFAVCANIINTFNFNKDGYEGIDGIFEFIVSSEKKGSKGQFFTPRYIIDFCIKVLNPQPNENFLDPAAGSGAFLYHAHNHSNIYGNNLWAFDFDSTAVRVARLLMYVAGIDSVHIHKANSLIKSSAQEHLIATGIAELSTTIEDILRIEKYKGAFDVIATNPPFAGEIIEQDIIDSYEITKGKKRAERDVLFVERCIKLLKPGGRMAIVLPDNIFGGTDNEALRKWIYENCRIVGVVGIPRNAFMPHTAVKTSILFLQKRETPRSQNENIFFGISEKPGKDSRGKILYLNENEHSWRNVDHDLNDIYSNFMTFIQEERIGW